MDFLKAEIERKRKKLQEVEKGGKKYFKRGDLMEKERQEYLKRHQPKQEEIEEIQQKPQTSKSKNVSNLLAIPNITFLV